MNYLRQESADGLKPSVGVAVLYLKYNDPEQTLDSLFGSLVQQLVQEMPVIAPDSVKL